MKQEHQYTKSPGTCPTSHQQTFGTLLSATHCGRQISRCPLPIRHRHLHKRVHKIYICNREGDIFLSSLAPPLQRTNLPSVVQRETERRKETDRSKIATTQERRGKDKEMSKVIKTASTRNPCSLIRAEAADAFRSTLLFCPIQSPPSIKVPVQVRHLGPRAYYVPPPAVTRATPVRTVHVIHI